MTRVRISIAESPRDVLAVQQLCRDFVGWVLEANPAHRDKILIYFEPVKWEQTLADLAVIHARPKGALLLARLDDLPVGCIMYHELEPAVAEVKRLFVSTDARGRGVASDLVRAMIQSARADGYDELRLDTTTFLDAAVALYRKHGFEVTPQGVDLPAEILDLVVYMQRKI